MANPFVELWTDPVATLTAIAYVLLLLSVTIALAGVLWHNAIRVRLAYEHRGLASKYGPKWEYVPPMALVARVAGMVFLAAVEFALLAGIAFVLS